MIKKVVSSILVFMLILQQTWAIDLGDMVSTASTKHSTWTSPMTGEKYFYSGSYQFTFNDTKSYAPWFNAGGSGDIFKADCGGFSIGDMFMSMLGLNDIKDQLSGAGAQLAWGLMIGLVYSMPGIKDVFMSIQKWARAIQKLLQDACKIGQTLSKNSPFGNVMKDAVDNIAESDIGKAIHNAKDGLIGKINTMTDWVKKVDCNKYAPNSSAYKSCMNIKNKSVKKVIQKLTSSPAGTSIFAIIAGSGANSNVLNTNGIYITKFSTFSKTGKIGDIQFIDSPKIGNIGKTLLLMRLFFQDSGIAKESINKLLGLTKCNSIAVEKCTVDPEKIKQITIHTAATGDSGNFDAKESIIPAVISDPKEIAHSFVYGLTKNSSLIENRCGDGYCYENDNFVVYANVPYINTTDTNSTATNNRVILMGNIVDNGNNEDLKVTWDGAIKESYKSIKHLVYLSDHINGSIGIFQDKNIPSTIDGNIPLVVPGIGKYIDIIAKIEKQNGAENAFTASLKELLAKYNAYLFSKSFFDMILNRINSTMGDSVTGVEYAKYKQLKDAMDNASNAVSQEFSVIIKKTERFKTLVDIFKTIDENYRQEIANTIQ